MVIKCADFATVLFDGAVTDGEAKTGTFTYLLGCVKRIEYLAGILQPGTGVSEFHANEWVILVDTDRQGSTLSRVHDGVYGVVDDVEEDLLQLVRVAGDIRDCWLVLSLDDHVVEF